MSDHWIAIVPKDPHFLPDPNAREAALELFRDIAPDADEIDIEISEVIRFFDCGGNFERVICPHCQQEISTEWWQDAMGDDYDGTGFRLDEYQAPCCGTTVRLNEL